MSILTHSYSVNALTHLMHTGTDYIVNSQNPSSRTFTVTFQSKQANSTENVIQLAADDIVEGTEVFHLRIVAARFIGQAANIFRAQDGLTNTVADVIIEDDDCKFMNTPSIICLQAVTRRAYIPRPIIARRTYNYIPVMHALSPPTVIEVSWIISEPIEVTEGERDPLELFAQAFGVYASHIEIGVVWAGVIVAGVPPGVNTISSTDTLEHTVIYHFSSICLQPSLAEIFLS